MRIYQEVGKNLSLAPFQSIPRSSMLLERSDHGVAVLARLIGKSHSMLCLLYAATIMLVYMYTHSRQRARI